MINLVIPMAGLGSRFAKQGYKNPKPLIDVLGKPMIQQVIENLTPNHPTRFIFICQKQHLIDAPAIKELLESTPGETEIVEIDGLTEGAACTVLKAQHLINNEDPLIIANCDQWIDGDLTPFFESCIHEEGAVLTFKADDPKWSFVRRDQNGKVSEIVEKQVVSDEATVGIYGFKQGSLFCQSAQKMISADDRVNGEFYVAPAYNYMITDGLKVTTTILNSDNGETMWGLGTPEDLTTFLDAKNG